MPTKTYHVLCKDFAISIEKLELLINAVFYTFPTHWCHNVKCHVEVVGGLTRAGTEAIPWLLLQQNTTLLPTPSPIKSWSWYCCTMAQT